jgi:cysteine-rich repeat protein/parallel beta-helix repeat protein
MRHTALFFGVLLSLLIGAPVPAHAINLCNNNTALRTTALCGDGICQLGESCDDGASNSDIAPNACRTTCRPAYCGDGFIDSGEQCDQGGENSNTNPSKCRQNCTPPRCGDGVTDNAAPYNEQCDDGNASDEDGCLKTCKPCVLLGEVGNIEVTDDTALCAGNVKLDDYGDYGTVVIKRSGITLDCNGLTLAGEGRGVGIMIYRSNNVTIKNCKIYGYETGIKGEDSNNVTLINNYLCGNHVADIDLPGATQMTGNSNKCKIPGNWNDTGEQGCSQTIHVCNLPTEQLRKVAPHGAAAKALMSMPYVSVQPNTTRETTVPKTNAPKLKTQIPSTATSGRRDVTEPRAKTPAALRPVLPVIKER